MASLQRRMLSKDEEASVGGADLEVRREDQDKINRFSRLHQKEEALEGRLKAKTKDKEDLEDISNELELADEDDKVPYKIGDTFISLPVSEVQELLSSSTSNIENTVSDIQGQISTIQEEMEQLKVQLYARFGKSINLES